MESTKEIVFGGIKQIWEIKFSFAFSMALKCAVELGIPDILNSHESPIPLAQIASGIDSPYVDLPYLTRIMRVLVYKEIFTAHLSENGETLYVLPEKSKWLLKDSDLSLSPFLLFVTNQWLEAPFHYFSECVKDGGNAFKKAHNGHEMWELLNQYPDFNKIFNEGLACVAKYPKKEIIVAYKEGFEQIKSLVDVGGGSGGYVVDIVKAYPHINGILFDLPHVVATAPTCDGVTLVGGNMFESIPSADAIFMKSVLHDWSDEHCVKILKNCRKALHANVGRVIVVEIVCNEQLKEDEMALDLMMFAHTTGGKERTELEFKKILEEAGFPRYKIIKLNQTHFSIIEAYPQ